MLIRSLLMLVLCCGVSLPDVALAQGELSQCRSAMKETWYPCRKAGAVVRSNRDHQLQERAIAKTGAPLDQSVLDQTQDDSALARQILRLLLDK